MTHRLSTLLLLLAASPVAGAQSATDTSRPRQQSVDRGAVDWISRFEAPLPEAAFGAGWGLSTDQASGGRSTAAIRVAEGGASGSGHALRVEGVVDGGLPYAWAGVSFYPGAARYSEADLSRKDSLVFFAKGDGGQYRVLVVSDAADGREARAERRFVAGAEWTRVALSLRDFRGVNLGAVKAITFAAGPKPGPFSFHVDDVRLP